ncbi:MAG: Gfo/Idh/MocA family oxidoreductase [Bryobacteraceae bacterium]|nr:Gfo/Idh/MocA family oxidoreductase [Bryobacteraceae bacterium]
MPAISRRSLMAGAAAFQIVKPELVRGAGQEKVKFGIVGCGGRGTEAAINLMTADANTELVAMADIFEDKLEGSLRNLRDPAFVQRVARREAALVDKPLDELVKSIGSRVKVDPEHHFVGFDAYKKLIASEVDLVLLVTPPGYRPEHFEAVINAGKHCWATKPIATDPVGVRRFMASVEVARQKRLCVNGGTPSVSARSALGTKEKIKAGAVGDIVSVQTRNQVGLVLHVTTGRDPRWGDMEWQHREWYSFVWICGDMLVEQAVHGVTFCNWMMDSHPERVVSSGGAAWRPREEMYGNIYDHHDSDFIYPNGAHLHSYCRQYPKGCANGVGNLFIGTKGRSNGHDLAGVERPGSSFVEEHMRMMKAIRGDAPYLNEGMVIAEGTMTCIMAREAAYSGLEITWDMIMNSKQDLQPKQFGYKLPMDAPPLPVPGQYKFV